MDNSSRGAIAVLDFWPDKASYAPGEPAVLCLRVLNTGPSAVALSLALHVTWLDTTVAREAYTRIVAPGETEARLPLRLPAQGFRGYGIDLALVDGGGAALAAASTALDVLDDWTQAPRYGFLADFAPGDPSARENVEALSRYHINVVQFYDWMWRHYALMPPREEFADALGRALSLRTVREKVAACRERGMAALGYAAVYGAEPEYAFAHPDEMLYDADGDPHSLEKLFYIMNIHRGNPWRAAILGEMARAVAEIPFDGLHLDQYGFPRAQAFGPAPGCIPYDVAADFPPFIDDARGAVRDARPGSRVIFNAVDNWPIEAVAPTSQDATYIEVWPPYDTYADLQTLILEARRLAPTKQVILAAYLAPLLGAAGTDLPHAQAATRLASAAIWANGGFHLLLGERDGALCDPYYPKYAALLPDFTRAMRRCYDFVVRYENALSDRGLVTAVGVAGLAAARLIGAPASPLAEAGTIWTVARTMPGLRTCSLINLTAATEANWNMPQPQPQPLRDLEVAIRVGGAVLGVFAASPDGEDSSAQPLPYREMGQGEERYVRVRLPHLEYWSLIVVKIDE